jgi:hypothetical protein
MNCLRKILLHLSCVANLLLVCTAGAQGLATVQRTFHSYGWGDRTYTCLAIDGGVVPLVIPPGNDATVSAGDDVTISWPTDGATAVIRPASKAEAALVDLMGKPDAADSWKRYIVSTLRDKGYTYQVHDFQPDILDVNHWRIGAITMDYSIGGRKTTSLSMLWRCKSGATLAVAMQADPGHFKSHSDQLFSLIGASMILKP